MTDYEGTCYIAVTGGETSYPQSDYSIHQLTIRPGDTLHIEMGTKGYEVRQSHLNKFMASDHDFILFLDQDQVFEPDTLERLRSHKLPYVSGYYMRRRFNPILPVWHEYPEENRLPYKPWSTDPERGRLHEIGASGWGCVLVHRQVIEGVRAILKGEPEILEDDMDVWPYDLRAVLRGEEQIRVLTGVKNHIIGSDVRFPFFAREAGFTLYGDPDVRPGHVASYIITPDDYTLNVNSEARAWIEREMEEVYRKAKAVFDQAQEALK